MYDWVSFNKKFNQYNSSFGIPCLVHATKKNHLSSIIRHKKLLVAHERETDHSGLGTDYFDEIAGIKNAMFFSPGFQYNTDERRGGELTVGLIFSPNIIDSKWTIYRFNVVHLLSKEFVRFLTKYDQKTIAYMKSIGLSDALDEFYKTDEDSLFHDRGVPSGNFKYWAYREELAKTIAELRRRSPKTFRKLEKHLRDVEKKTRVRFFRKSYLKNAFWDANRRRHETVCHKSLSLDSKHFLGFFIKNASLKDEQLLKTFLSDCEHIKQLILFDGKKKKIIQK